MRRTELAETLRELRVVASVPVLDERRLARTAAALYGGGMRAVELPYTAVQGTGRLVQDLKEDGLLVGVGAITRSSQAREAGMLGADFVAAAVIAPDIVPACKEADVPCILSGFTPTEVWRAHEMEADFVKIPAESLGGPRYVRSLRETLPAPHLMGADVPLKGFLSYLEEGVELLEFKSSLALSELAEGEGWAEISRRASKITVAHEGWKANRDRRL